MIEPEPGPPRWLVEQHTSGRRNPPVVTEGSFPSFQSLIRIENQRPVTEQASPEHNPDGGTWSLRWSKEGTRVQLRFILQLPEGHKLRFMGGSIQDPDYDQDDDTGGRFHVMKNCGVEVGSQGEVGCVLIFAVPNPEGEYLVIGGAGGWFVDEAGWARTTHYSGTWTIDLSRVEPDESGGQEPRPPKFPPLPR